MTVEEAKASLRAALQREADRLNEGSHGWSVSLGAADDSQGVSLTHNIEVNFTYVGLGG